MYWFISLSIYLFVCLSIYLFVCLSVCLSVYLSIYLSIYPAIYLVHIICGGSFSVCRAGYSTWSGEWVDISVFAAFSRCWEFLGSLDNSSELAVEKLLVQPERETAEAKSKLGGGFKYFLFPPLPGEDSHFDKYFSMGLKPPTSKGRGLYSCMFIDILWRWPAWLLFFSPSPRLVCNYLWYNPTTARDPTVLLSQVSPRPWNMYRTQ